MGAINGYEEVWGRRYQTEADVPVVRSDGHIREREEVDHHVACTLLLN